jgi:hypothetical protein
MEFLYSTYSLDSRDFWNRSNEWDLWKDNWDYNYISESFFFPFSFYYNKMDLTEDENGPTIPSWMEISLTLEYGSPKISPTPPL